MWLRSREEWWAAGEMALPVALALLLVLLVYWFIKRQRVVRLISQIPGPKGLPLLGVALEVNVSNVELFHLINRYCGYGGIVSMWLGPQPSVMLSGPREAETLLTSQRNIDKSEDYDFMHPWLGTGLLTSTGSKWHSRRKLLTPAFHFKILEDFVEVFNKQSGRMVEKLRDLADGRTFDIFPKVALCTLDIICEAAMGRTVNAQDQEESEYVKAVQKIGYMVQQRSVMLWLQFDSIYWLMGLKKQHDACLATLHKFSRDTIKERRALFNRAQEHRGAPSEEDRLLGKRKRLAFLDLLLESSDGGKGLSNEDIREEVDTFMFEGHDTTAAGISWTLYLLGRHPEIQARVHEELVGIFGESDRPATLEDLRQMKYTENCLKEALRVFPSVPYIARKLTEDMMINNYLVPAGTMITLNNYMLHRDPEQFPDPEKFDPDRFLPENVAKRHPFAYVPFSAGPRNCIGQKFAMLEEKVVVSSVLRNFRLKSNTPRADLGLVGELIIRAKNGIPIRIFPRTK